MSFAKPTTIDPFARWWLFTGAAVLTAGAAVYGIIAASAKESRSAHEAWYSGGVAVGTGLATLGYLGHKTWPKTLTTPRIVVALTALAYACAGMGYFANYNTARANQVVWAGIGMFPGTFSPFFLSAVTTAILYKTGILKNPPVLPVPAVVTPPQAPAPYDYAYSSEEGA
jgi:hypothetical protein